MDAKTKKALLAAVDELKKEILADNLDGVKLALQNVQVLGEKIKEPLPGAGTNGHI